MRALTAEKLAAVEEKGFAVIPSFLSKPQIESLVSAIEAHSDSPSVRIRAGARSIAEIVPEVRELQQNASLLAIASEVLGAPAFVVRSILFDKVPGANWKVSWHQDLTICAREPRDVPGFGPWSVKDGIPHVQPPIAVLERMITLRMHLDPCVAENGALRVLAGTHRSGRLTPEQIAAARAEAREVICEVEAGGLLLMRPLLLHASSPAMSPSHRRVLHFECAAAPLPEPLAWHVPSRKV